MKTKKRVVIVSFVAVIVLGLCAWAQMNPSRVDDQQSAMTDVGRPSTELIVTTKRIAKGAVIRPEDVTLEASYGSVGFRAKSEVVGKKAVRDLEPGYKMTFVDLQSASSKVKPAKEAQESIKQDRKK